MDEILRGRFLALFDEINMLLPSIRKKRPQEADDDFIDLLLEAYAEGLAAGEVMTGYETEIDGDRLDSVLAKQYDGESIYNKLEGYIENGDEAGLKNLLESEAHRVYNEGIGQVADETNSDKIWHTMLDDKVRDTHVYLEGKRVGYNEYFETYDGDRALFPGGFETAQNNANCRCVIELTGKS